MISSINIAGGIVDYAEENNIDMIVIGIRGRSGFKNLLLGKCCVTCCNLCTLSSTGCKIIVIRRPRVIKDNLNAFG